MKQHWWILLLGALACKGGAPGVDDNIEDVSPEAVAREPLASSDVRPMGSPGESERDAPVERRRFSTAPAVQARPIGPPDPSGAEGSALPALPEPGVTLSVGDECGIEATDGTDVSCEAGSYCFKPASGELARCTLSSRPRPSGG